MYEGNRYENLKKVYHIDIVYFELGHGDDYVYHGSTSFTGIHKKDELQLDSQQKKLFQQERIDEIYPEYYILKINGFDDVAKDSLDEWIYYFKNNRIPDSFKAQGLSEARKRLQLDKLSDAERASYIRHIDQWRYESSTLISAEEKGEIRGEAKGLAKGLAEGEGERQKLAQRIAQGEEERQKLAQSLEEAMAAIAKKDEETKQLIAKLAERDRK
jgi:oligoribonuclease NrnB/cAMP/cGMP phosphodiesterase (DHH superfamily)